MSIHKSLITYLFAVFIALFLVYSFQSLAKKRNEQYLRLSERIDREKKMFVITQKIQTRKDLQVSAFMNPFNMTVLFNYAWIFISVFFDIRIFSHDELLVIL